MRRPVRSGRADATRPSGPLPAERVARVLEEVAAASPETVPGHVARRVVRRIRREAGCSRADYRELWARPRAAFGPFDELPETLKDALRAAVSRETEERRFRVGPRLHRVARGSVFRLGGELARAGRRIRSRGGPGKKAGRAVYLCGRGICWLCEQAGRVWLDATRFTPLAEVSPLHALWKWAGVDPMRAAIDYVRGVPCDPTLGPVFRSPRRNVEAWMMVGLDLLPSDGDLYYVETNLNPGFMMDRSDIHPDRDPIVETVVDHARSRGLRRLVVFPSSITSITRKLEGIWRRQTRAAGIELEVRDDPRVRSPYRRGVHPDLDPGAEDTLYLNVRTLPHPVCTLLAEKGLFEDEIARHNRGAPADRRILAPRRIRSKADLPPASTRTRFPNVVVKDPLQDEARAIWLYRTSELEEEKLLPPHVAFEYVPPETEERTLNGVPGEYGFKYRVNLLITPDGPRVAEVVKVTAGAPVPRRLEEGPVPDLRPYVASSHVEGSDWFTASDEAYERVAPAAMRVGRLVHDFLGRLHGPGRPGGTRGSGAGSPEREAW